MRGLAFGGWCEHGHLSFGGGLQVGACAVAGVGHGQGLGRAGGGPEVFAGLLHHGPELAGVGFLPGDFAGDDHAFLFVGDGLRVAGMAVAAFDIHAPGFPLDGMVVGAPIGGQLGQAFLDLFAQGFSLGQAGGQARARRVEIGVFLGHFQLGLIEGLIQRGQEFFHVRAGPAAVTAWRTPGSWGRQGLAGPAPPRRCGGPLARFV